MKILYSTDKGVAVINPTGEWLANHTIEELAIKDVPVGAEYHIVDDSILPTDRRFRSAWVLEGATIQIDAIKQAAIQVKLEALETK
tara:strand:- start:339 stop:596 length:258 start_codon:yes stop_codon:yes gene_type:complete